MSKFKTTKREFTRDPAFSVDEYFGDSFSLLRGDKAHKIRIRFNWYGATFVKERRWHESQKLRDLPDGGLEMELTVNNLDEIKSWVLKWNGDAQAIEPPELIEKIREAAAQIIKAHS